MTAQTKQISVAQQKAPPRANNLWIDAARRLARQPLSILSGVIVIILILTAIFGSMLAPYDPNEIEMGNHTYCYSNSLSSLFFLN